MDSLGPDELRTRIATVRREVSAMRPQLERLGSEARALMVAVKVGADGAAERAARNQPDYRYADDDGREAFETVVGWDSLVDESVSAAESLVGGWSGMEF